MQEEKVVQKKITRMNIGDYLFDRQLALIGKTRIDVVDDDRWWFNFTIPRIVYHQFKKESILLIKKVFKCRKAKAENVFNWFYATFGVRIINK